MTNHIVTINSDPSTLGDEATERDVERYAANLGAYLTEKYGCEVEVRTIQTLRSASCQTSSEIEAEVREIHAGDRWIEFLDA